MLNISLVLTICKQINNCSYGVKLLVIKAIQGKKRAGLHIRVMSVLYCCSVGYNATNTAVKEGVGALAV